MSVEMPPAAPQAKGRNTLLIAVIVVAVLGCCCLITAVAGYFVLVPVMDATNLSIICTLQNPDADSEECTEWATDVRTIHAQDYTECMAETSVYQCLDDRGLGLND